MNMEADILKYQKHELLGKKFGQLTVIEQLPTNSHGEKNGFVYAIVATNMKLLPTI